jgi:hypothetical protein
MNTAAADRLVSSSEQIIAEVENGMDPTAALAKIAAANRHTPEETRRLGEAYNQSRTLFQLTSANGMAKLAGFATADPDKAIIMAFPPPKPGLGQITHQETPDFRELNKQAAIRRSDSMNTTEKYELPKCPEIEATKATLAKQAAEERFNQAISEANIAAADLEVELNKAAEELRDHRNDIPFDRWEQTVRHRLGDAVTPLVDIIHFKAEGTKNQMKRADARQLDFSSNPLIDSIPGLAIMERVVKAAAALHHKTQQMRQIKNSMAKVAYDHVRGSGTSIEGFFQRNTPPITPYLTPHVAPTRLLTSNVGETNSTPMLRLSNTSASEHPASQAIGRAYNSILGPDFLKSVVNPFMPPPTPATPAVTPTTPKNYSGPDAGLMDVMMSGRGNSPSALISAISDKLNSDLAAYKATKPTKVPTPTTPSKPEAATTTNTKPMNKSSFLNTTKGVLADAYENLQIPNTEDTFQKEVLNAMTGISDPKLREDQRQVRIRAVLNDMMVNDDVISGYSPEEVLDVYNQIQDIAPQSIDHPALLRGWLRQGLELGTLPSFEAGALLTQDKTLGDVALRQQATYVDTLTNPEKIIQAKSRSNTDASEKIWRALGSAPKIL